MSFAMTIRVPDEVRDELEALAKMTGRTRSWLAAEAINEYLERERWQVAQIQEGLAAADAGDFADPEEVATVFGKWIDRAS
ncbi:ribbon-helix-helix protein, CopG family (plasmid) [Acidithiobacillus sp. YTS05]|nr:ribbon-helix-helix protein, CopG family [Acidithiobacillus sp. YTS05]